MTSRMLRTFGRPPAIASMMMPNVVCSWRVLVEVVEDDIGHLAALQLDDDAHAVAIRLVAQVARCPR